VGIREMGNIVSELKPAVRAEITQVLPIYFGKDPNCADLISLNFLINQSLNVIFVSRPETCLLIPHPIELLTSDHQITRTGYSKIWEDLKSIFPLPFSFFNLIEIHAYLLPVVT
jgi:hypothetical protein